MILICSSNSKNKHTVYHSIAPPLEILQSDAVIIIGTLSCLLRGHMACEKICGFCWWAKFARWERSWLAVAACNVARLHLVHAGSLEAASRFQFGIVWNRQPTAHGQPCQVFHTHCLHYRRPPQLHVCILNLLDATLEHANVVDTLLWNWLSGQALEILQRWRQADHCITTQNRETVSLAIHSHKLYCWTWSWIHPFLV